MAKHDDDLKDSFYLYIMRNSVGAGLRTEYVPNGHMPARLTELMRELGAIEHGAEKQGTTEKPGAEKHLVEEQPAEAEDNENHRPAYKQVRKR